jgi:hypothetical protein
MFNKMNMDGNQDLFSESKLEQLPNSLKEIKNYIQIIRAFKEYYIDKEKNFETENVNFKSIQHDIDYLLIKNLKSIIITVDDSIYSIGFKITEYTLQRGYSLTHILTKKYSSSTNRNYSVIYYYFQKI